MLALTPSGMNAAAYARSGSTWPSRRATGECNPNMIIIFDIWGRCEKNQEQKRRSTLEVAPLIYAAGFF
jgi:hypothetical protein